MEIKFLANFEKAKTQLTKKKKNEPTKRWSVHTLELEIFSNTSNSAKQKPRGVLLLGE